MNNLEERIQNWKNLERYADAIGKYLVSWFLNTVISCAIIIMITLTYWLVRFVFGV